MRGFPAQLAGVGDAEGIDRHVPQRDSLGGVVREGFVRNVLFDDCLHHLPRMRPPKSKPSQAGRKIDQVHGSVGRRMLPQPGQVVRQESPAGEDPEAILRSAYQRQVALDPAARREQRGVCDPADGPVHSIRGQTLQEGDGSRAADFNGRQSRHVHQADAVAQRQVLGTLDGGPVLARPAATPRDAVLILLQQGSIGLVPLRRLPAGVGEEDGLLLHKVCVERAETQVTGSSDCFKGWMMSYTSR